MQVDGNRATSANVYNDVFGSNRSAAKYRHALKEEIAALFQHRGSVYPSSGACAQSIAFAVSIISGYFRSVRASSPFRETGSKVCSGCGGKALANPDSKRPPAASSTWSPRRRGVKTKGRFNFRAVAMTAMVDCSWDPTGQEAIDLTGS